ncbi:hypothetical protein HPP92_018649 [Vanilla planifolia]|uniref:t-SNARE coiled-coil homology domain-containing protein n=1 Tax=Vanilla planifolia TaxID=51239 RepID=A0A835QCF5_VANPL|nr:hypothetical protein HPP92_018649 [Vanilla planifolia]
MDADVARAPEESEARSSEGAEAPERSDRAEPGSSAERTRTSVVSGLRKKLRDQMEAFGELRRRVAEDHRDSVARRTTTVTGRSLTRQLLTRWLWLVGRILTAALAGRGELRRLGAEMKERRGAVEELERSLLELHQVFLDMAVLVEEQGHQVDDIESQVGRARSYIDRGVKQLGVARRHQKNTRKWTCFALILLLIIILVIVLPIVLKN